MLHVQLTLARMYSPALAAVHLAIAALLAYFVLPLLFVRNLRVRRKLHMVAVG